MKKIFDIAIIGCGSRGQDIYGNQVYKEKDRFRITAVCDVNPIKLQIAKNSWNLDSGSLFADEKEFFKERRADALIIATQDRDHVRMAIKALKVGYDILLEKPISPFKKELKSLLEAQKKYGGEILVCHVLRYAPAFIKIKTLMNEGSIGKLICIESLEQVAYWHQAHSFVRGNWRNDEETSPMILQKCCHDLDLLQYYAGSECEFVYSVGDLKYFRKENQPDGAAKTCLKCKYKEECPYSAERLYLETWKKDGEPSDFWPWNVVDLERPITEKSLRRACEDGQYGRCVYDCDNNVVDNQTVLIGFANGVKATLTMTAFTNDNGRKMTFHGSLGEIELNETKGYLRHSVFGKETKIYEIADLLKEISADAFGHGGGDYKLIDSFYNMLIRKGEQDTALKNSIESHLMALAAESSRKTGKTVYIHNRVKK